MKLSELFEANYKNQSVSSIIDAEIQRQYNAKKPKQPDDVKARNAYSRGFRGAFSGRGADDTGISDAMIEHFTRGKKDGAAARKKAGEVPEPFIVKNGYGEKKPNQAFEKMVKAAMAVTEDLNEGVVKDEVIGLTKPEVTKYMKKQGFSKFKVPGGEAEYEASYRSDNGFGFWMVEFNDGKAFKIKKSG